MTAVVVIVALALLFDFINGFHDAANSIATVVSTRVLSPRRAVLLAAVFNFVAFLFFGLHVANAIGRGIVDPSIVDQWVVASALTGAIVWDLITWYFGIPSSSSHALIGGLIGAALAKTGDTAILALGLGPAVGQDGVPVAFLARLTKLHQTVLSIAGSPLFGLLLAAVLMLAVYWVFRRYTPFRIDTWFRRVQLLSASLYSLGHGGNDAQKTMGVIAVLLYAHHAAEAKAQGLPAPDFKVALWVVLACHAAMGLGTLAGGWRIVKTMGMKITKLKPVHGFCAETAGAATLFLATAFGIPVSTTHTITGAIVGVGTMTNVSGVRWAVAGRILWAWVLTIPASALVAGGTHAALSAIGVATR